MTFWQVSPGLSTTPAVIETTSAAILAIPFDLAALLAVGQTASAPTATLTDLATGAVTRPEVTQAGTVLTAVVQRLVAFHDYRLLWSWQINATNRPSRITFIRCVA